MASVGEENVIQVWEVNAAIHEEVKPADRKVFDMVTRAIESAPSSSDSRTIDFAGILSSLPPDFASAFIHQPTSHQLEQSPTFAAVGQFMQNYAAKIDTQLNHIGGPDGLSGNNPKSASSRAKSGSPARKRLKQQANPPIAVKLKSTLAAIPESTKPAQRTTPIEIDAESLETIRSFKYWSDELRRLQPDTVKYAHARAEYETAKKEVCDLVSSATPPAPTRMTADDSSTDDSTSDDEPLITPKPPKKPLARPRAKTNKTTTTLSTRTR